MPQSRPLTDREMFSARPWRAPNRAQVIVAVVEDAQGWMLVLTSLQGSWLYSKPLDYARTPASFSDTELESFYDEACAVIAS